MTGHVTSQVMSRIIKEVRALATSPPDGIVYLPNEDGDLSEIQVEIAGPTGTPYDGGFFTMKLVLTTDFPASPPKGVFLTKIFHPNVSSTGVRIE